MPFAGSDANHDFESPDRMTEHNTIIDKLASSRRVQTTNSMVTSDQKKSRPFLNMFQ